MIRLRRSLFRSLVVLWFAIPFARLIADENPESPKPTDATRRMHDEVATLKITVEQGKDKRVSAELRADPILRYTDPQREFPDATLWVWTVDGRPAAFSKLERCPLNGVSNWQYCLSAVNDDHLSVRWPDGIVWKSKRAGLAFQKLEDQEAPQKTARLRLIQFRKIASRFRARTTDRNNAQEEMRLLTQPIFRYSNPDQSLIDGAVFGVASNGTNPDALLLVQVRHTVAETQPIWEFGCLALSGDAVSFDLDDKPVFKHEGARNPGDHGHWLWLLTPEN